MFRMWSSADHRSASVNETAHATAEQEVMYLVYEILLVRVSEPKERTGRNTRQGSTGLMDFTFHFLFAHQPECRPCVSIRGLISRTRELPGSLEQ